MRQCEGKIAVYGFNRSQLMRLNLTQPVDLRGDAVAAYALTHRCPGFDLQTKEGIRVMHIAVINFPPVKAGKDAEVRE